MYVVIYPVDNVIYLSKNPGQTYKEAPKFARQCYSRDDLQLEFRVRNILWK